MPRAARAYVTPALVALAGVALLGALGLADFAWSDYETEQLPAVRALADGDLSGFLALAPVYGGSLLLRAPFAFVPGGDLAIFRALAVPCLLLLAVIAVVLFARSRTPLGAWVALGLVAGNPLALRALEFGHAEELLAGALCVLAVLAAGGGRPLVAGLLLGAAMAGKPWAVLAGVPVLLVLGSHRHRAIAVAAAAVVGGAFVLPLVLAGGRAAAETGAVGLGSSTIFNPAQVWWFLADGLVTDGPRAGYRAAPEWIGLVTRTTVLALALGVTLAVAAVRRRLDVTGALGLLALALLVRCVVDPWNVVYYELAFLLALVAWEVHARRGPPVVSLVVTLACWVTLDVLAGADPDLQAAWFLAWALPTAAALATPLMRRAGATAAPPSAAAPGRARPSAAAPPPA